MSPLRLADRAARPSPSKLRESIQAEIGSERTPRDLGLCRFRPSPSVNEGLIENRRRLRPRGLIKRSAAMPNLQDRPADADWLRALQTPPAQLPADADKLDADSLLRDDQHRPIVDRDAWLARRATIRARWLEFLGEIPKPAVAPKIQVLEEDRPENVVRQLIRYEAELGLPIEGYLLFPQGDPPQGGWPAAVVMHSTQDYTIRQPAGLEGKPEMFLGLELAKRGYVAMCPRCYLWQYGKPGRGIIEAVDWLRKRHPQVKGMAKMLFDAIRAVDLLVARSDVNARKIAAIGHSLGSKEALYLAAFDERVQAAVASEGGVGISYSNWEAPWYLSDAAKRPGFGRTHAEIVALAAPRALLLIGGDSADGDKSWPYVAAGKPVWSLLGRPEAVGLLNHKAGHALPAPAREIAFRWISRFLDHPATP